MVDPGFLTIGQSRTRKRNPTGQGWEERRERRREEESLPGGAKPS
jgi:hypothetical protein